MGERVEKFEAGSVTGSALNRSAFSPALSSREGNVSLSVWFFASQLAVRYEWVVRWTW